MFQITKPIKTMFATLTPMSFTNIQGFYKIPWGMYRFSSPLGLIPISLNLGAGWSVIVCLLQWCDLLTCDVYSLDYFVLSRFFLLRHYRSSFTRLLRTTTFSSSFIIMRLSSAAVVAVVAASSLPAYAVPFQWVSCLRLYPINSADVYIS